jgi:hypothetical protein
MTHVVARSPDRATRTDRRSPETREALEGLVETFGQVQWHGRETVPQREEFGNEREPFQVMCGILAGLFSEALVISSRLRQAERT